jgi:hypothetical protein
VETTIERVYEFNLGREVVSAAKITAMFNLYKIKGMQDRVLLPACLMKLPLQGIVRVKKWIFGWFSHIAAYSIEQPVIALHEI